jgi:peptidoglycan/LPS O-acetylase OafA/YrhL
MPDAPTSLPSAAAAPSPPAPHQPDAAPGAGPERLHAIDWLKAAAILAVIATHAAAPFFSKSRSMADVIVGIFADFHVPCFFAVSGFLYATERQKDTAAATRRRLLRLLVPYLVAVTFAYLLGIARAGSLLQLLGQVALGGTLGIYYFVFVLLIFVLLAGVLGAMSARVAEVLLVATLSYWALAALVPALRQGGDLFWYLRNPATHAGYFLLGWVARLHRQSLTAPERQMRPLVWLIAAGMLVVYFGASLAATIAAAGSPGPRLVYVVAVLLLAITAAPAWSPRGVSFLSQSSYPLYLFHTFFQDPLRGAVAGHAPPFRIALLFLAGLLGASLTVLLARALLGRRLSRVLLGT